MVESSAQTLTLPIEVHVFEHEGQYYAFDIRNFTILKMGQQPAEILKRASIQPISDIIGELKSFIPAPAIRSYYLQFLNLLHNGVLSDTPVAAPRKQPFHRIVLLLAGGCNMGCLYCFEKDVPSYQGLNLMTREGAEEILHWFFTHQKGKKAHIQLYGGEPLLNWSILQYVVKRIDSWAQDRGLELTKYLITNGTLLNPERISWLKSHQISIQVSVDGEAETHDRFRVLKTGKPSMALIQPNLKELSSQKADYNLRAVLTRQNPDPNQVINGLRSFGAERVSFEVVATDLIEARLTAEDWGNFHEKYYNFLHAPFSEWKRLPDEMQSLIIRLCERRRVFYGCGAGISEVTVAPDGSIYECQRMYRAPIGHVSENKGLDELNSRFLTMVDERIFCQECWARYLCGGGCMHQAYMESCKTEPLSQFCHTKRLLAEAAIVKIHQIRSSHLIKESDMNYHLDAGCIIDY